MSAGLLPALGSGLRGLPAATAAPVSRCGCGAEVLQVATTAGAAVLLERRPHPDGNIVPRRTAQGRPVAHVLTEAAAALSGGPRWRAHEAVCPAANSTPAPRAHRHGLVLSNMRCPVCGERMAVLLLRLAEPTHPSCGLARGSRRAGPRS